MKIILFVSALMLGINLPAASAGLEIECEGSAHPSCCAAISDSHGSSAHWYSWGKSKGYYDSSLTLGNYTTHHCNPGDSGGFELDAASLEYQPSGPQRATPTGLISFGNGTCVNNNSN